MLHGQTEWPVSIAKRYNFNLSFNMNKPCRDSGSLEPECEPEWRFMPNLKSTSTVATRFRNSLCHQMR